MKKDKVCLEKAVQALLHRNAASLETSGQVEHGEQGLLSLVLSLKEAAGAGCRCSCA